MKECWVTEQGGTVVTLWNHVWEIPNSNPGTGKPYWNFFVIFLSLRQMLGWNLITMIQ